MESVYFPIIDAEEHVDQSKRNVFINSHKNSLIQMLVVEILTMNSILLNSEKGNKNESNELISNYQRRVITRLMYRLLNQIPAKDRDTGKNQRNICQQITNLAFHIGKLQEKKNVLDLAQNKAKKISVQSRTTAEQILKYILEYMKFEQEIQDNGNAQIDKDLENNQEFFKNVFDCNMKKSSAFNDSMISQDPQENSQTIL